jgi:NhaP-type Na+/H+ or K+/H+ antiporter
MSLLAILVALLFLYSLVSNRLERTVLTAPIVFTTAGMLVLLCMPGLRHRQGSLEVLLRLAEVGLVLLLFTEASRTDLKLLKSSQNLPVRLLSIGMLLTILLGAICAKVVFRQISIGVAGILAAILAPTDAGLGQVIVESPRVPARISQALNMEAGLNDGLSVPFLMFFVALAATPAGGHRARLMEFIVEQLGLGMLIGAGIGLVGGWLLGLAHRKAWMSETFHTIGLVTLPLLCAMVCEFIGGSMFIAAFVAGMTVQAGFKEAGKHGVEFAANWGQLMNLAVFFLFGLLATRNWQQFSPAFVLYAILSLTVIRMLPVAIALLGTRLSWPTVLFMGWFGPRGLGSIVLGLVYLERGLHQAGESTIRLAVMTTVWISIFVHGLSAQPGINLYAKRVARLGADALECQEPGLAVEPVSQRES